MWRTPALEASFQFLTRILKSDTCTAYGVEKIPNMGQTYGGTALHRLSYSPVSPREVGRVWGGVILRSDKQLLARYGAQCFPYIVSFYLLNLMKWMALPLFTDEETEPQNGRAATVTCQVSAVTAS